MGTTGRKKKYETKRELQKAVDGYFKAISYREPVVVETATGEVDEDGNARTVKRMLTDGRDGAGKPITVERYFMTPSVAALCLHLGISRETWNQYAADEALSGVVEETRMRMEAYLTDRLTTQKSVQGVIFNLKNNYGWTEKQELELGRNTRESMKGAASYQEKLAFLQLDDPEGRYGDEDEMDEG